VVVLAEEVQLQEEELARREGSVADLDLTESAKERRILEEVLLQREGGRFWRKKFTPRKKDHQTEH
jgi:hypothetical protein